MISIEFLITSLVVVLIPGTGVIYTVSVGLLQGARASIYAALGCTVGIIPHLIASTLGIAAILHTSALAFQVIKWLGVLYLFYLAWGMWKSKDSFAVEPQEEQTTSYLNIVIKTALVNVLNPKLSLFFLAFLPQFLPVQSASFQHVLALSSIFMLMTFIVFSLYGLLATKVRHYVLGSPKIMQRLQQSFAMAFAVLGMKLALTER